MEIGGGRTLIYKYDYFFVILLYYYNKLDISVNIIVIPINEAVGLFISRDASSPNIL